jgi:tRNA threonylcarbamoyladenosine biosynthesis protein TsaE
MASSTSVKPAHSVITSSEEETLTLARRLGAALKPGDWIALIGDLGAGKTLFVKGLADSLHCAEPPVSPTFSLVQIHPPKPGPHRFPLRHVDLYRLAPKDVPSLEWEELMDDRGVTAVEWADKARFLWPAQAVEIRLLHQGDNRRLIEIFGGPRAQELAKKMKETR